MHPPPPFTLLLFLFKFLPVRFTPWDLISLGYEHCDELVLTWLTGITDYIRHRIDQHKVQRTLFASRFIAIDINHSNCFAMLIINAFALLLQTLCICRYADQAKQIVNNAVVNENENAAIVSALREELDELKKAAASSNGLSKEEASNLRAEIEERERLLCEANLTWEEKLSATQRELTARAEAAEREAVRQTEENAALRAQIHATKRAHELEVARMKEEQAAERARIEEKQAAERAAFDARMAELEREVATRSVKTAEHQHEANAAARRTELDDDGGSNDDTTSARSEAGATTSALVAVSAPLSSSSEEGTRNTVEE